MARRTNFRIGEWYTNQGGERLEIIAIDHDDSTIEIQYFDGAIEEIDFDTWLESGMVQMAAPEDWSGPFDDLVQDDFGDTEVVKNPQKRGSPLEIIEMEEEVDFSEI